MNGVIIPSSGGSGANLNYSTSEHVVGTWIDGSTLYAKTFQKTTTQDGSNVVVEFNTGISTANIKKVEYLLRYMDGSTLIHGSYSSWASWIGYIKITMPSSIPTSADVDVTIYYTK